MPQPPPPETIPSFAEAAALSAFWDAHYDEFLAHYPDQYVAVRWPGGQFLLADADLGSLYRRVEALGLRLGRGAEMEFISSDPASLIL